MSTKITAIMTRLVSFFQEQFPEPTSQEHPNPYALELNDEHSLRDGWSFAIGPVQNTEEMASCQLSVVRDIVLNRSLQVFGAKEDKEIRRAVEIQLLEDQFKVLKEIENDPTLEGLIALHTFVGDNGIELIQGDPEVRFLALRSTISIRYYEQL